MDVVPAMNTTPTNTKSRINVLFDIMKIELLLKLGEEITLVPSTLI
jgi:hypothetical protein